MRWHQKFKPLKRMNLFLCTVFGAMACFGFSFADSNVVQPSVTTTPVQIMAPAGADYHDVMLRVGITPAKSNLEKITVGVNGGIEVYNYQNGVETLLMKTATSNTPSFVKGKQHIVIGTVTDSKEAMIAQYTNIQPNFPNAFVGYDGGWRIYYGSYDQEGDAQADLAKLSQSFPTLSIALEKQVDGKVDILDNGTPVFSYQSLTGQFFIKSMSGADGQASRVAFKKATDKATSNPTYRGGMGARNNKGYGLVLINYLPMEDYLKSVIVDEMGGSWPLEAMKAQAVAARDYAMINTNKHNTYGYDLCNDVDCQVYSGASRETALSVQAIEETKGIVMTYGNNLINAVYHSNSGGHTESVENVWGGKPVPYLTAVEDPFSVDPVVPKGANGNWVTTMSYGDIENKLRAAGKDVGNLSSVQVSQFSQNGRALSVVFYGSQGRVELKKESVRLLLGTSKLKSTWFEIQLGRDLGGTGNSRSSDSSGGVVTFIGHGNGHGVGMSQWGANAMAKKGYTFDRILATYYTGIALDYADRLKK